MEAGGIEPAVRGTQRYSALLRAGIFGALITAEYPRLPSARPRGTAGLRDENQRNSHAGEKIIPQKKQIVVSKPVQKWEYIQQYRI